MSVFSASDLSICTPDSQATRLTAAAVPARAARSVLRSASTAAAPEVAFTNELEEQTENRSGGHFLDEGPRGTGPALFRIVRVTPCE